MVFQCLRAEVQVPLATFPIMFGHFPSPDSFNIKDKVSSAMVV